MSTKAIQNNQPIHWILDWDGTITKKDTLDSLVSIAATAKPTFPTREHWTSVSQAYIDDYSRTLKQLSPDGSLPTTVVEEKRLLEKLREVEQRSLDRVSSSGIFAGLTGQAINTGAHQVIASHQVELRNGSSSFFQYIHSQGSDPVILSVNWSRHFIRSCLSAASISLPRSCIHTNELDQIDSGNPSNGHIVSADPSGDVIISSGDKLRTLEQMRTSHFHARSGETTPIVYVGDSWTDIECLLAADLGICIRDEPVGSSQRKLMEALERLGVECPRLRDWKNSDAKGIAWARDFCEIKDWVDSLSMQGASIKYAH
jgi:2-hydroxy-3-keto-5-methylthiopentenyl-1-phosphate phosphatase